MNPKGVPPPGTRLRRIDVDLDALLDRYLAGGVQGQELAAEVGYSQGWLAHQLRARAIRRGLYAEYRAAVRAIYRRRQLRTFANRQQNPPRSGGSWGVGDEEAPC